jgi:hypothetical protein
MANTTDTLYSLEDFLAGIAGETGARMDLKVVVMGDLRVELRAAAGHEPAARLSYKARGPIGTTLSGTTDDDGRLAHAVVPAGVYKLTIDDLTIDVPTVQRDDRPHVRWISRHPRRGS